VVRFSTGDLGNLLNGDYSKMKKFRAITTVGALTCAFILMIGIFTAGAVELCFWDPTEPEDLGRINLLIELYDITSGNIPVHGFGGPITGDPRMILTGNGRVVGNDLIIHMSGSGPRPGDFEYEIINATAVIDLTTGVVTVEGIRMVADRTAPPPNTSLDYLGPWLQYLIACP
jgi:hypothetical protein